ASRRRAERGAHRNGAGRSMDVRHRRRHGGAKATEDLRIEVEPGASSRSATGVVPKIIKVVHATNQPRRLARLRGRYRTFGSGDPPTDAQAGRPGSIPARSVPVSGDDRGYRRLAPFARAVAARSSWNAIIRSRSASSLIASIRTARSPALRA